MMTMLSLLVIGSKVHKCSKTAKKSGLSAYYNLILPFNFQQYAPSIWDEIRGIQDALNIPT
ncbi:hypothetical protein [Staphylococcus americanisciuri]|uniref:Uncharacterized protein n=1 Tax=Staphylococcus americanisciuri TaxID=2973940 RepID=A0ABT2F509_9STAP|nr:hypothetical protein [Staphylococcus americanisciuri]MCS4486930.1 hypothetical protein [Staphylococcus americanisciuri]